MVWCGKPEIMGPQVSYPQGGEGFGVKRNDNNNSFSLTLLSQCIRQHSHMPFRMGPMLVYKEWLIIDNKEQLSLKKTLLMEAKIEGFSSASSGLRHKGAACPVT
ncbi:unnamed protein product [Arctogadus glacialis]